MSEMSPNSSLENKDRNAWVTSAKQKLYLSLFSSWEEIKSNYSSVVGRDDPYGSLPS